MLCALCGLMPRAAHADVSKPEIVNAPSAPYPAGAAGDAEVELLVLVGEDGSVSEVSVRAGAAPFAEAAREAVQAWSFKPAMRDNVPVRARILVKVSFQAPAPPASAVAPAPRVAPPAAAGVSNGEPEQPAPASIPPSAPPPPVEITVQGEQHEDPGPIHIPRGDARLIPGAFADPFRVVEILPGVAPVLSGIPYFFVRGAPPGDVGYYIDEIRVPLLFHVGAGPSVIAPALVDRVELIPSAYPARFGRFAGGIMAGDTQAPSAVARGEAQARVFDAGAMLERPFANGRGSVLLAGRYSYTQALLSVVAPDYGLGYWDYQARVAYSLSAHDRVQVFGFGAYDHLENKRRGQTLFDVGFHRLDLRWDHTTEDSHTRLALTLGRDDRVNSDENDTGPGSRSRSRQIELRLSSRQRVSSTLELRAGMDADVEGYGDELDERNGVGVSTPAHTDLNLAQYADIALRPQRGFEIVPGFRLDTARSVGRWLVFPEPRLATRARVSQRVAWLSNFGLTHQLPAYRVFVPGGQPGVLEWGVQRAYQASQGLEFALPESVYSRVSVFHSWIEDRDTQVTGRNYGTELFLRRDFSERLGGFLSYTLSRTMRTAGRDTEPSDFDRPHVVSLVLGYDLGKGFRLGGRAYYASGRRYRFGCPTPDCGPGAASNGTPFVREGRVAGFFRLDTRFEKRWRFASGAWVAAAFEWFNTLVAQETNTYRYNPLLGVVRDTQSPLTLPSIGIEAGY